MNYLTTKIEKIRKKHDGGVFLNIMYELYIRAYINPTFRQLLQSILSRNCCLPSRMIFLVGCFNSGTTILRDILKSHPDIDGMPREGVRFTDAFPDMQEDGWIRMAYRNRFYPSSFFSEEEVREKLNRDWGFWAKKGAPFFLEKSITHSFRLPFLQKVFPDACFIAITRDGYCSTEGILRRANPSYKAEKELKRKTYPVELCARQWVYINQLILSAQSEGVKIKHIKFEDFVSSPYEILSEIFNFIGVDTKYLSVKSNVVSISQKKFKILNTNPDSRKRFAAENIPQFNEYSAELMNYFDYQLMKVP